MTPHLGVDPGRTDGAAVLLDSDGERVLAWWTWKLLKRKGGEAWRVSYSSRGAWVGRSAVLASMWEVGQVCWSEAQLTVEGLFVPRHRKGRPVNPQAVIPLAEATGELIGGLRMTPRYRPLATEWRSDQLGLRANASAKGAEDYAVKMAPHRFTWPEGAGLDQAPTAAERGALAEAAFIARYGWSRAKWEARTARPPATPASGR